MEVHDGMMITAVDDYANETPLVVEGDNLVALEDSRAVTVDGKAALEDAGLEDAELAEPLQLQVFEGPVVQPMSTCGSWMNWVAPAGGSWNTSSKTCGVWGATANAKTTYTWDVANAGACAQAKGYARHFSDHFYYEAYWKGGGCDEAYARNYIEVTWGEVLSVPSMKFRSTSYTNGSSGDWN
ncbi:hypothetical protein [Demequina sp. NBRC 110051]|uniref:hypothetical protein n=1 Tax=Demequina sp. NBRC 110051 TaxID=1570340 RepID=UPI0011806466|nr:hypothetical protein [Demequina sp. NBRC 110051]